MPFTNWIGSRNDRTTMRGFAAVVVGLIAIGFSVYSGIIKQDLTWRNRRNMTRRYTHITGREALMYGIIGTAGGILVAGYGVYLLRSTPPAQW